MKPFVRGTSPLLSVLLLASFAAGDARDDYRQLIKEHQQAVQEFEQELERLREAGKAAEAAAYEASWNPTSAFVETFAEKADEYAGTEDAVSFLLWVVQHDALEGDSIGKQGAKALSTLVEQHPEDPSFVNTVDSGGFYAYRVGLEECLAIMTELVEIAPQDLKLRALLARGGARMLLGEGEGDLKLARADIVRVQELGPETEVAARADNFLFEIDHLQIGQVAPDIEGADLGGVTFKLSDYRGKVVVLDFWGDW